MANIMILKFQHFNILLSLFFLFNLLDKEFTSFPFYFRVMEWVSDDMNNAVNDGDGGEDDGRPISLVRCMANRDRGWI